VAEGYVDRKRSAAISFAAAGELPSVYVEKIVGDVLSDVRAALEIAYHPQIACSWPLRLRAVQEAVGD
jgi:hypothetical protein